MIMGIDGDQQESIGFAEQEGNTMMGGKGSSVTEENWANDHTVSMPTVHEQSNLVATKQLTLRK